MRTGARNGNGSPEPATAVVRCIVYCRQSVEERNKSDFRSNEAQHENGAKYGSLFADRGWQVLPDRYEDSGFSGGTLDRPALTRLRADIAAGKIDCVIVYRSDRLSRSIRDFLELMEEFDRHGVAFVSVSEQFDTSTPSGRMHRNMLLTFAQYERELIAERTRDKVHAARRRGKFTGGLLPLGYDLDPKGGRMVVNAAEAERVREIFRAFLKNPSVPDLAAELTRRGWTLKRWETKKGRIFGGGRFDKFNLRRFLANPVYAGKVLLKGALYDGEHEAIIDQVTWQRVQEVFTEKLLGPRRRSSKSPAILAGRLFCKPCDRAMTPTYSQKGRTRFRYYLCNAAHKHGWSTCPTKSIPARAIERFVVDQIRTIGRDPELVARTTEAAGELLVARKVELAAEAKRLAKELEAAHRDLRKALRPVGGNGRRNGRPGDLTSREEAIRDLEARLAATQADQEVLRGQAIDPTDLKAALAAFEPVWDRMSPTEQARVVDLLIERVDYDGGAGRLGVSFRTAGVRLAATQGRAATVEVGA